MNKRILKIIGIIFGLLAIAALVYALIPRSSIILSIAPEEFTISIDGKDTHTAQTGDVLTVAPGTYKITISRDEFDPYTKTVTVKNGQTFDLLYALNPLTEEAKALLKTPKSQEIIQRIAGQKMNVEEDQMVKDYPIVEVLPITDKYFTVSSCASEKYPNDSTKLAICVNLYDMQAKSSAIDAVLQTGFDLNDYETRFIDSTYETTEQRGGD